MSDVGSAAWIQEQLAALSGDVSGLASQADMDAAEAAIALLSAGKQPLDSDLTAIAALSTTSFGRSFLTLANAAGALSLIGAQATSQKNQPNGYAGLNSSGEIVTSALPAIAITETNVVASQAAQLALTAQMGDVAVRSDENKTYIHNGGTAGTMADWTLLATPADVVLSVAGKTGAVTLTAADITNFNTAVRTNRRDQMAAPTADLSMAGHKHTGVGPATGPGEYVEHNQYLDGISLAQRGFQIKTPAQFVVTDPLPAHTRSGDTLTATGAGYFPNNSGFNQWGVQSGHRVLVVGEGGGSHLENGLYVVESAGEPSVAAWQITRTADATTGTLTSGAYVPVTPPPFYLASGFGNHSPYYLATSDPINVNSTALSWLPANQVEAWSAPTFTNGYTNVGSGTETAGYYKDPFGVVHLKGSVVRSPSTTASMFTLPTSYRPSATRSFAVPATLATGTVNVASNGQVTLTTGSSAAYVALDGISFRT